MLRKLWSAEAGLFLAFWLGLLWFGQSQFLFDPGVFWNTVVGQRILETGDVPRSDEFSCTFRGREWQSHQWLTQVVMAALHAVGGLDALCLATAALLAATYAWAVLRLVRAGWHPIAVAFFAALLFLGSRYHWLARPQIATIALLGVVFADLVDFEAGRSSWRRLLWLPPLFVLWANLHGGALGGLATVAVVFAGWCGAWLLGRPSPLGNWSDGIRLVLLGAACVLATCVNPYGPSLPLGWIRLMDLKVLSKYILEHMPLDWSNPYQRGILAFGVVYATLLATVPWRQWRVTWFVPLIWFALTLQRARHCTLFSITAVIALADMRIYSRWGLLCGRNESDRSAAPNAMRAWAVPAAAFATALALQAFGLAVPLIGVGHAKIDPALAPTELIAPLRERSRPGDAVFNEMAQGGFLIYYLPELRVYIDDRCELYGDAFIAQFYDLYTLLNELREKKADPAAYDSADRWADAYGIRLALVTKDQGLDYYFSRVPERWKRLAETKSEQSPGTLAGAVLYERTAP